MNLEFAPVRQAYGVKDTILYALGVGATIGKDSPSDLKYIYEGEGFVALPTFAVILGQGPFWMMDPELGIDWRNILHAEQMLTLHASIPAEGTIVATESIDGIYDKGPGRGALCYTSRKLRDAETDELLAEVRIGSYWRADGGFGGERGEAPVPHPTPERPADHILDMPTREDQAAIYRLSGDVNPLHIDPVAAQKLGFERPILHGLCGYGIAGRALINTCCENDPARLRELDLRFRSPVYPGETLRFDIWQEGPGIASFQATVIEREVIALSNGRCRFD